MIELKLNRTGYTTLAISITCVCVCVCIACKNEIGTQLFIKNFEILNSIFKWEKNGYAAIRLETRFFFGNSSEVTLSGT